MEEESEDLYETAQALLDPATGSFTTEVSERLEYVGSALLVMDRVTLDPLWRGHGLAAVLGCESSPGSWPAAGPSPAHPVSPTSAAGV
ncbi:hypothetical protein E4N62_13295 [Streptomyces sp. MNU76]|uniref:hypothetical protein n=1 Tax=Streptomyces sp. MNU76 TaxID=2560026 RepID=UPI001E298E5C|nr:hypothetical protein [Streptomyces sp. MNU76]MCC9706157.1 hypothetical protein [Streptomyces sp. MNU76]